MGVGLGSLLFLQLDGVRLGQLDEEVPDGDRRCENQLTTPRNVELHPSRDCLEHLAVGLPWGKANGHLALLDRDETLERVS